MKDRVCVTTAVTSFADGVTTAVTVFVLGALVTVCVCVFVTTVVLHTEVVTGDASGQACLHPWQIDDDA